MLRQCGALPELCLDMEMPTLHCAAGFLLGRSVYPPLLAAKWADLAKIILQHAQTRETAPGPHDLCFLSLTLSLKCWDTLPCQEKGEKMPPPKTQTHEARSCFLRWMCRRGAEPALDLSSPQPHHEPSHRDLDGHRCACRLPAFLGASVGDILQGHVNRGCG